jgi:dihydroorotate dehydrogenase
MSGRKGEFARVPETLNLRAFVQALLSGLQSPYKAEEELADRLGVNSKTIRHWMMAEMTDRGPSISVTEASYTALCGEGRRQGNNVELFYRQPLGWSGRSHAPLHPPVNIGRRFKSQGIKIAGVFFDSPLILTAGAFSEHAADIRWFLECGVSGVETKTFLSHERQRRTDSSLLSFTTPPPIVPADHPRDPVCAFTMPFDTRLVDPRGVGVRLGAPSPTPHTWMAEVDSAIANMNSGECLLLSIGAHVPKRPARIDRQEILRDWEANAENAAQTRAPIIVANLCFSAFSEYYEDLSFMADVCRVIRRVLKDQRLFLKLSYLPEKQLEHLLLAVPGGIDGVIAVNCEPGLACSTDIEGQVAPIWSNSESRIGIAGPPLFPLNLRFLQHFVRIRERHAHLRALAIVSCGGVSQESQITQLLDMGADGVGINSAIFCDCFFPLKARRYIDGNWDRRKNRMNQESARMRDIWNAAYQRVVEPLNPDSPEFDRCHQNAIRLLDQILLESHRRIGALEQANRTQQNRIQVMSLEDMCERIRGGL